MLKQGQIGSKSINRELLRVLSVASAAPVNGEAASLTTALTGADNDLVFTAKIKGTGGNAISVSYVDPGEETAEESVDVSGTDIVVTLRSVSATLSTAAQVKAAIEASSEADALVSVANSGGDDGSGSVIAMAEDALEGGIDCTIAEALTVVYYGGYMYFTPTATTTASASWVKSAQWGAL